MDNLRNQMAALVQGIATSARERERVIGEIKGQTANMLRAFGRERTAMASALKTSLAADRMSRSADVLAICDNTSTMCDGFRQDHVRMRRSLRQGLDQSREAVVSAVASLRVDFDKERVAFAKSYRHMVKAQHADLTKDRRDRSNAVAALMKGFAKAHHHMAKAQHAELTKERRDRSHTVAELMQDFHVSRGKMAQELAASLAKSMQDIKDQVSGLSGSWVPHLKTSQAVNLPASLLAEQPVEELLEPISASAHEPEKEEVEERQEKTAIGEAARHIVGKPGKPKKK